VVVLAIIRVNGVTVIKRNAVGLLTVVVVVVVVVVISMLLLLLLQTCFFRVVYLNECLLDVFFYTCKRKNVLFESTNRSVSQFTSWSTTNAPTRTRRNIQKTEV